MLKWALLGIFCIIFTPGVYKIMLLYGVGVKFYNNYPGKCNVVPGVETGSEKVVTTEDGLAFITSGLRGFTHHNLNTLTGKIYLFDMNAPEKGVVDLQILSKTIKVEQFDPVGMDLLDEGGSVKLFVVNHANGVESVEVFAFNRKQTTEVVHERSIVNDNFTCLNDIAVVNQDTFYVTNLAEYCLGNHLLLETLLAFKTANIVRFDGKKGETKIVADKYPGLNGIALSDSHLFTASLSNASVYVFARDDRADTLRLTTTINTKYNCDNIHLDRQTGDLYVATFKTFLRTFFASTSNGATGIRITPNNNNWSEAEVTEVFHDNGAMLNSASMIVHQRKKYLIGSIHNRLVYCDDS